MIWHSAHLLVSKTMVLKSNVGSDRSWVYNCASDFAEGEARPEVLAIRFGSSEIAENFKVKFEEAAEINEKLSGDAAPAKEETKEEEKKEEEEEKEEDVKEEEKKEEEATEEKQE